ncbi:helix-turn-helix transcriptional regulator [Taibaiella chishuiensis]|uniref:AraC-like DNA-binding protein n=1 Tax=Taibaiella chishuiensis TaxID=1434707 RepID=A0A2P8D7U4_9BACT|nr:helix-turn-helix transcriptional regulator [Taibaiella chishuiensis]PSK93294.1 AraC-like DNA-binding protein [Taibaiella chishuiensis]
MQYKQFDIPPALKDKVHSFWTLEDDGSGTMPKVFRTIADGRPGLIFQHSDSGTMYKAGKKLPPLFLYGATTKHSLITLEGNFKTTGVFFSPLVLKTVFGLDASLLTDDCMDGADIHQAGRQRLLEQLLNSNTGAQQVDMLSGFLSGAVKGDVPSRDKVEYAVSRIMAKRGNITIEELTRDIYVTERSLERAFKAFVGMSPKLFIRISRFRAAMGQLNNSDYGRLTDIAFAHDYADQSHFTRTFREFTGFSPRQYLRQSGEVA